MHVYKKKSSLLNFSYRMKLIDVKIDYFMAKIGVNQCFLFFQSEPDNFLYFFSS